MPSPGAPPDASATGAADEVDWKAKFLEEERKRKEAEEILEGYRELSIKTLISREEAFPKLIPAESKGSNVGRNNRHKPAEAVVFDDFVLPKFEDSSSFRDYTDKYPHGLERSSQLLGCTDNFDYKYGSEGDIGDLTSAALRDAVTLASRVTNEKFQIRKENGLFTNRPDKYVIYLQESPLLAMEDKKPFVDRFAELETLNGQCLDYASLLMLRGLRVPFVVATTFERSVIYCLTDEVSKQCLANAVERIDRFLKSNSSPTAKSPAQVQSVSPPELMNDDDDDSGDKPRRTLRKRDKQKVAVRTGALGRSGYDSCMNFEEENGRKVLCTKEFQSHELVRLLFYAILISLAANKSDKTEAKRKIPLLEKNYNGFALKLTETSYSWGKLTYSAYNHTNIGTQKQKKRRINTFFVIAFLGSGDTSNAFYGLDQFGNDRVIKMYVKRFDEEDKFLESNEFLYRAKKATQGEVDKYKKLYPEMQVTQQKIYNHFCIVMPFFRPIPKQERRSVLPEVKKQLEMFEKKGLKYNKDDMQWRHVGKDCNGNVILFDLGNLEDANEGCVDLQLEELKSRI